MANAPRYLVIDGYTKSGRDELEGGGASTAGVLYDLMLKRCSPEGTECDIIYPADPDSRLPDGAGLSQYAGVAWTGCSLCIMDDIKEVRDQIELAKTAFATGVPSFGSCWAAQIAVVAAGGACAANPKGREMGIGRKIALTPEGMAHPMYHGKSSVFDAYISHDDEVTHLPPGAVLLASNPWTHVQSVAVTHKGGTFWGLQYHPEYNLHEVARLTYCRIEKLIKRGFFQDRQAAESYVGVLEAIHSDPTRKDLKWMVGIDDDVLNEDIRCTEVRNWVEQQVLPRLVSRGA